MDNKQQLADQIFSAVTELNKKIELAQKSGLTVHVWQSSFSKTISASVYEQTDFKQSTPHITINVTNKSSREEFTDFINKAIKDGIIEI